MNSPLPKILGYGLGECAYSLVMNGLFGFAMLYYTEALGLSPSLAGLALSASLLWEMVADPVMGHVSDRTRSRYGRRHPWMLLGGLVMAVCFYFLWAVPASLRGQTLPLFVYLATVNLLLRTGVTLFFVPYLALGFEVCPDYQGRSRVQAVRQVMNMAANFAGPALAWSLFFRDSVGPDGAKILGTSVPENYTRMGLVFAGASFICVLATLWFTRRWCEDTRQSPAAAKKKEPFFSGLKQSFSDACLRLVLLVVFLLCTGMVLVGSFQIYVYICFMRFEPGQKSLAHGSTMIGMALGGILSAWLAKRLEKKGAVLAGGLLSLLCSSGLALLFLTGWVAVETRTAFVAFLLLHGLFWLGNGIALPSCTAMVADVAGLWRRRTGENKDGAYSALFSVSLKIAIALGLMGSGGVLSAIGFNPGAAAGERPAEVVWCLGCATFLVAPLLTAFALLAVTRYPLSRRMLEE
jgi:GPH family glycoside/pentoside/hexuronide:cation symporter